MFDNLTDTQQKVIPLSGKVILKACPGSGKTYVIAHKVVSEFGKWKDRNKGMAILSFTNVAKDELLDNIKKITGQISIPYPHFVGTLDSFVAQYIILPFGNSITNCSNPPTVIEGDFYDSIKIKYWKTDCYKNCCELKDFYIKPDKTTCDEKGKLQKCQFVGKKPCEKAKEYLFNKAIFSCKEAILMAIEILKKKPEILGLIANRFSYFIVDEAQDTSAEQMELLNLLFNHGVENAILIGDPDQAIYEWRDADPKVFLDMYNDDNWNSLELNENFRCSQHICNATKAFSSLESASLAVGDTKAFPHKPIIVRYKPEEKEKLINDFLQFINLNGIETSVKKVAILNRGRVGISNKDYTSIDDLWQNTETYLLAEATYAQGTNNSARIQDKVEKALYYLIFGKYEKIDYELIKKSFDIKTWRSMIFYLSVNLPTPDVSLSAWKKEVVKILSDFLKKFNLKFKNSYEIKTKTRVIKNAELKDFLDQPLRAFFTGHSKEKYTNSTIHSVKGCTFDAVMLVISAKGKLTEKMINTSPVDSEEIRTFYVAATRAKKIFVLALPYKKNAPVDSKRLPKGLWNYKDNILDD